MRVSARRVGARSRSPDSPANESEGTPQSNGSRDTQVMPTLPAASSRPENPVRDLDREWVAVTRTLWMVRPRSTLIWIGAEIDDVSVAPPSSGNTFTASDWLRWYCACAFSTTALPPRPWPPRPPRPPPPPPPRPPCPRCGVAPKLCVSRTLRPSLVVADVVLRRKFCDDPARLGRGM